jgi:hypothetical protein
VQIEQQIGYGDVVANFMFLSVENHLHVLAPGEKKTAPASGAALPSHIRDGRAPRPVRRVPYAGITQFRF